MSKNILTIGFELASDDVGYERLRSTASLSDWDIILIKPTMDDFSHHTLTYQGKPRLDENDSFRLQETCEHWRREILRAVESGKTVVIFLPQNEEVFIDTGNRTFSGTGKNQKTTIHVEPFSIYKLIPRNINPINATGSAIRLVGGNAQLLRPYWAEFSDVSLYNVTFDAEADPNICLTTRDSRRAVGGVFRSKTGLDHWFFCRILTSSQRILSLQ